jgi:hypothetical protein
MIVPVFHQQEAEAGKAMGRSVHIYIGEIFFQGLQPLDSFSFTRSVPQGYDLERG